MVNKFFIGGILLLALLTAAGFSLNNGYLATVIQAEAGPVVDLGGVTIAVTIAQTKAERIQGLSGTESLPIKGGKLFIFEQSERHGIWMKDMNYPLDIFWLDADKRIVHIEENVSPDSYPETFRPNAPARYVLETNAHVARDYSVRLGDQSAFRNITE